MHSTQLDCLLEILLCTIRLLSPSLCRLKLQPGSLFPKSETTPPKQPHALNSASKQSAWNLYENVRHDVQAEAASLKAELLALRQHNLRSRALSTAGSDLASSDEDDGVGEVEEQLSEHSFVTRSRRSR